MKDIVRDRLIMLAKSRERMSEIDKKIAMWDSFQLTVEKSMFETMNTSDKVLNLSRQGKRLVNLLENYSHEQPGVTEVGTPEVNLIVKDIQRIFEEICFNSAKINEFMHRFEGEIACQREIEDELQKEMSQIGECLDSALACAELVMAEM